jgi:hypothetical protein
MGEREDGRFRILVNAAMSRLLALVYGSTLNSTQPVEPARALQPSVSYGKCKLALSHSARSAVLCP